MCVCVSVCACMLQRNIDKIRRGLESSPSLTKTPFQVKLPTIFKIVRGPGGFFFFIKWDNKVKLFYSEIFFLV